MKKTLSFIVDIGITALIVSIFFFEDNKFVNLYAVVILIASLYGAFVAIFGPIKAFSQKGFMWEYYVSSIVRIVILYQTKFQIIAKIYIVSAVFVLIKNLLGQRIYKDHKIYLKK